MYVNVFGDDKMDVLHKFLLSKTWTAIELCELHVNTQGYSQIFGVSLKHFYDRFCNNIYLVN